MNNSFIAVLHLTVTVMVPSFINFWMFSFISANMILNITETCDYTEITKTKYQ